MAVCGKAFRLLRGKEPIAAWNMATSQPASDAPSGQDPKVKDDIRASGISRASVVMSLVLSVAVLAVIGVVTIEPDTLEQMLQIRWWLLLAALLTVGLRVFFGAWRLHYFAQGRLRWMGALRAQLAWDFFSNVTPSTIGGGPIAPAYIVRDSRIPLGDATSIILFAMLMDQIWFTLAIMLTFVFGLYVEIIPSSLGTVGDITFTVYLLCFMAWVLVFGYATLVRPHLLERFIDRLFRLFWLRRFHGRVLSMMGQLQERARILRTQRPRFYLKGLVLTIAVWLSRYLLIVAILWSVAPDVDKLLALLRTVVMMLGALVMPTPGGAGGIEGLYALMVGPLIPEALVAPTLLLWRLLGYYIFLAVGAYLTVYHVQKTRKNRKNVETTVEEPAA